MPHPRHQEPPGLSRQARKTIQAIKTDESVPAHSVHVLLNCLGFRMKQKGTHQVWRHPKGYRYNLVHRNKDDGIWGYALKDLRTLIQEIETKEGTFEAPKTERKEENDMALDFGKVKEKYTPSEVAAYKDSQVLLEKSLPDLTKLDLTKLNEKNTLKALSDSHAEMISFMKRLGSMTQSIQDYLIELSVKVDDLKAGLQTANAKPLKDKMTREQLLKFKSDTAKKLQESKRAERIKNIKALQAKHPEFAKNAAVIAGLSGVGVKTVEKYMEQGLV